MSKRRNETLEKHRLSKIYDLVDVVKHYLELRKGYSVPLKVETLFRIL
jgi:hypothetical protein